MEDLYCYTCGQVQRFEKDESRYDWDDNGKIQITDFTCLNCKRRTRLHKRVEANYLEEKTR